MYVDENMPTVIERSMWMWMAITTWLHIKMYWYNDDINGNDNVIVHEKVPMPRAMMTTTHMKICQCQHQWQCTWKCVNDRVSDFEVIFKSH